ncbi:hypothetical protein OC846_003846 [Tilletia horrida]|uniref:DH domain-containing protein n=1 Tax=Tilletia horrida TaxID=155126 RepID=A0AAN6JQY9_9BASI|nr:hypothetical protein OC846_003846 [Tilletia horrida]
MASAATATPPLPPTGTVTSASVSALGRLLGSPASPLKGSPTVSTSITCSAPSSACSPPTHSHSPRANPNRLTASSSSSSSRARTTAVPLSYHLKNTSLETSDENDTNDEPNSTPTFSPSASSSSTGTAATTRPGSSSSASTSRLSSSWSAAARSASMAPYRVLAAALPSLLNLSPELEAEHAAEDANQQEGPSTQATALIVDDQAQGLSESEDEDEVVPEAVTAWQTPELGATLQVAQDSPSTRPIALPSALGNGHVSSAATALLQAISAASAARSSAASDTRARTGNHTLVGASAASSLMHATVSDLEDDDSEEGHESGSEEGTEDMIASHLGADDATRAFSARRHRRQKSSFFSIASMRTSSMVHHQQEKGQPTRSDREAGSSGSQLNAGLGLELGADQEGGDVGNDTVGQVTAMPIMMLTSASVPNHAASPGDMPHGDVQTTLSQLGRTPSSSTAATTTTTTSSSISVDLASVPGSNLSSSASAHATSPSDSDASGSVTSAPPGMSLSVLSSLGFELGPQARMHKASGGELSQHAGELEIAGEDVQLYYHGGVRPAAPSSLAELDSDRTTTKAASTIGLNTPHPSLVTLSINTNQEPEHDETTGATRELGVGPAELVASPVEMESGHFGPLMAPAPVDTGSLQTPKRTHSGGGAETPAVATGVEEPSSLLEASASSTSPREGEDAARRQKKANERAEHRREMQRLALLELVRTERSYADDLALLVMVFFENLVVLPSFSSTIATNGSGGHGNGAASDMEQSDSKSGTDPGGDDHHEHAGAGSKGEDFRAMERNTSATGSAGASGSHGSGSAAATQTGMQSTSSASQNRSQLASSGIVTSAPIPMAEASSLRPLVALRRPSDPAMERLDLVTRNAEELLSLHQSAAWRLEAIVSRYGLDHPESDPAVKIKLSHTALEEGTRKIAEYLSNTLAPSLRELYASFCSKHMEALSAVKDAERRGPAEWAAYERTCADILQVVAARMSPTLPLPSSSPVDPSSSASQSGAASMSQANQHQHQHHHHHQSSPLAPLLGKGSRPHKLVFHDYFVKPIQRIALYPLLLQSLLKYCSESAPLGSTGDGNLDPRTPEPEAAKTGTGKDRDAVSKAMEALVGVVEHVNEAGRLRLEERLSQTISDRIEVHYNVTPSFLHSLGHCLLSGTLDVLYYQRHGFPLSSPLRLKYHGCVLYHGFMLIVKVRKSATYEPRFWFPLWLARLSDVPEDSRFLPHSFRLSVRNHHFELVASNDRERQLWIEALGEAISKASFTPPGAEAAFPSSLFVDTGGSGSRPSSRTTHRASSRLSVHAAPPIPGSRAGEAVEELESMADTQQSPRKNRFSNSHAGGGRISAPPSPSTHSAAKFDAHGSPTSPAPDPSEEDELQQFLEETAEVQVRRSSPYQRSVIDRAMAFSTSVIAARAPRTAHDAAHPLVAMAAPGDAFALATPAHGPGWQHSLGALVGLGRMGSMETSTLRVQRRKSYAGNVDDIPFSAQSTDALLAGIGGPGLHHGGNSAAVPFPTQPMAAQGSGMSNRAMRTWRQLSLKTASRSSSVRPLSDVFPPAVTMIPGLSIASEGVAASITDQPITFEPNSATLSLAPRPPASRRESFANNLRDALSVPFGRRQRSQSSQDVEQDSYPASAVGTDPSVPSSTFTSGINTPYLASTSHSPSMHASLLLTPVQLDSDSASVVKSGRADSIRRVFGSIRGKRERTLSMPVPVDLQLNGVNAGAGAVAGVNEFGEIAIGEPNAAQGLISLGEEAGSALQSQTGSAETGVVDAAALQPPVRSLSRASMQLQRSRTALGKIWFGGGGANGVPHMQPHLSSSTGSSSSTNSGFLSVGGMVRSAVPPGRRSTDSFASSRSKSAIVLPTVRSSIGSASPVRASGGEDGSSRSPHAVSASGSPSDPSPDQGLSFTTSTSTRQQSDSPGPVNASPGVGVSPTTETPSTSLYATPTSSPAAGASPGSAGAGAGVGRRPRMNFKLSSSAAHRLSSVMLPLPTLPATPAEELDLNLDAEIPASTSVGSPPVVAAT